MGQCPSFDPTRPPQLSPVQETWQRIIRSGDVKQLLQAPTLRLQLTTKCQLCQMAYQRASDLSLHLQTVHALHWQQSQRIHPLLLNACQARDGCYCNPQSNARGLSHSCPALRQLSMMAVHMGQDLFVPWQFDQQGLAGIMTPNLCPAVTLQLQQCLIQRDFAKLWTDSTLMTALANTCAFCGGIFPTAALRDHVSSQHIQAGDTDLDVLAQLVPCFHAASLTDHTCHACKQIFNVPCEACTDDELLQRRRLAHLHLAHQCPVLLQTALLLTHGYRESTLPSGAGGLRNVRSLRTNEPSLGNVPKNTRRGKRKQEASQRRNSPEATRSRSRPPSHAGYGQSVTQDGCGTAATEKTRLLDLLHANRRPGSLTINDGPGSDLEDTDGNPEEAGHLSLGHPSAALPPTPTPGEDLAGQTSSLDGLRRRIHHDADGQEAQFADAGGNLPIPTMESTCSTAPTDKPDADPTKQNGEVPGTDAGADEGPTSSGEISVLETSGIPQGGSLALANLIATRRFATIADDSPGQHDLEHGGHAGETALIDPEQAGHGAEGAHGEGTRQRPTEDPASSNVMGSLFPDRDVLRKCFEQLRLANHANWCFINSAFLATVWAMLSCAEFTELLGTTCHCPGQISPDAHH